MKKIFSFILVFTIVFVLSGCTDNEPMETRLDELELQVEELQTETDSKDELLDSIISNIANLNDSIYDDTSVTELIADLQLWQDNNVDNDTVYDDTVILELIAELQLWKDTQNEEVVLEIDPGYTSPITKEFIYTGRYIDDFEIMIRPTDLCSAWTTAVIYQTEYIITFNNICLSIGGSVYINVDNIAVSYQHFISVHHEYNENDAFIYEYLGVIFTEGTFPEIPE